jgi:DNA-binding response OmpR family regulator
MEGSAMKYCSEGPVPFRQSKLLNCLLVNQGRVCTKEELFQYLYGDDSDGGPLEGTKIVDIFVMRLRRRGWPIETEWGRGYIIRWQRPAPGEESAARPAYVKRPSIRRAVLDLFLSRRGQFIAVAEISRLLAHISADAPSNHISHLRKTGWPVEHKRGAGYRLRFGRDGERPKEGVYYCFQASVIGKSAA